MPDRFQGREFVVVVVDVKWRPAGRVAHRDVAEYQPTRRDRRGKSRGERCREGRVGFDGDDTKAAPKVVRSIISVIRTNMVDEVALFSGSPSLGAALVGMGVRGSNRTPDAVDLAGFSKNREAAQRAKRRDGGSSPSHVLIGMRGNLTPKFSYGGVS